MLKVTEIAFSCYPVKDMARAGQDAYWQAFIGGKPRTEADKLHDLMWGKGEPERER